MSVGPLAFAVLVVFWADEANVKVACMAFDMANHATKFPPTGRILEHLLNHVGVFLGFLSPSDDQFLDLVVQEDVLGAIGRIGRIDECTQ